MIESHGKLLISAFIAILIGVILLGAIADDVEQVKTESYTSINETLTLASISATVLNESIVMTNQTSPDLNISGTLTNDTLLTVTGIRNVTMESVIGGCNWTILTSGIIDCNITVTGNGSVFVDYTYSNGRSATLTEDELLSVEALRNITSDNIVSYCNVTLATGVLGCNETKSATAYADYTYESDTNFVRSGTTKTLLTLLILFFAIAILTVGLGFVIKSFKESNLM